MRIFKKCLLFCSVLMGVSLPIASSIASLTPCTGRLINPVTDICWECLLPITIGATPLMVGTNPDTRNSTSTFCTCDSGLFPAIGVAVGYWEPMELIDVTRSPYCLVNLGGWKILDSLHDGAVSMNDPAVNTGFFYVHAIHFPIMQFLGLPTPNCADAEKITLTYLSELDPTWEDETLALTLFPETVLFNSLPMQAACAVDAVAAAVYLPMDSLFWCAGAQGTMYPLTGMISEYMGGVQGSVLLSERLIFKLHRLGLMRDSSPDHLCHDRLKPTLPKSRYRYQMVYPTATITANGCQPFGRTTMGWGSWLESPISTENYGYLIFRKRNCCFSD